MSLKYIFSGINNMPLKDMPGVASINNTGTINFQIKNLKDLDTKFFYKVMLESNSGKKIIVNNLVNEKTGERGQFNLAYLI